MLGKQFVVAVLLLKFASDPVQETFGYCLRAFNTTVLSGRGPVHSGVDIFLLWSTPFVIDVLKQTVCENLTLILYLFSFYAS